MNDKYIIFSPFRSGLVNVIMSYELAFSIAHITNRKLILPPTLWLTHITEHNKENWVSLWDLFDKNNNEFDTIELAEFEEFKDKISSLGNHSSWFINSPNEIADCYSPPEIPHHMPMANANFCVVNNIEKYKNDEDFINFVSTRKLIDLNRPEKFLYIEGSLFQHYWYWLYAGNSAQRNILKNKINKVFRYHRKYYDVVKNNVTEKLGKYNAVHVRRGDFFIQYGHALETINTEDKLLSQVEKLLDPNLPLYIATDEPNREFFNEVAKKYKIFFIDDFVKDLPKLDCAIIEQIICSQAEQFEGTLPSTYTKRINIMRGLDHRVSTDYTGVNNIVAKTPDMDMPLPWVNGQNKLWGWNMSSHPQWTQEDVS